MRGSARPPAGRCLPAAAPPGPLRACGAEPGRAGLYGNGPRSHWPRTGGSGVNLIPEVGRGGGTEGKVRWRVGCGPPAPWPWGAGGVGRDGPGVRGTPLRGLAPLWRRSARVTQRTEPPAQLWDAHGSTSPNVMTVPAPASPHLGTSLCRRVCARAGNRDLSGNGGSCPGEPVLRGRDGSLPGAAAAPCPQDEPRGGWCRCAAGELEKGSAIATCCSDPSGRASRLRGVPCKLINGQK